MQRLWALRTMAPEDLMSFGVIHLRHLQAEGRGHITNPHADMIEKVMAELSDRLQTLQREIDAGTYNRHNWPALKAR